jgi:hypothetical protein
MLTDGIVLLSGSTAHNFTIEHGTTLPNTPVDGQLFRLTATSGGYFPALYWYNATTSKWITSDIHTITAGTGITATEVDGVVTISSTGGSGSIAAGTGISTDTVSGVTTITNSGITSITAGTGATVNTSNGVATISVNGAISQVALNISGSLTALTGAARWYPPRNITLTDITVFVNTAPTSATTVIDLLKNNLSLLAGGTYPTISIGQNSSSVVSLSATLTPTDYLTVNLTSAGGAADMFIRIRYL